MDVVVIPRREHGTLGAASPTLPFPFTLPPPFPLVQLLSILPYTILQWLLAMGAAACAAIFIIRNLYVALRSSMVPASMRTVLVTAAVTELLFGVLLKMVFFSW